MDTFYYRRSITSDSISGFSHPTQSLLPVLLSLDPNVTFLSPIVLGDLKHVPVANVSRTCEARKSSVRW